ncbi:MAG: diacylglycerol kinase family lipid kinase [Actinomycetota bacterium]|nr:diacylglycerol kinase family lipid kinase [Actinomycetota bacterium]
MLGNPWFWVVAAIVVVAVVVVLIGARNSRGGGPRLGTGLGRRPHRNDFRPEGAQEAPEPLRRAAVIANPTKFTDLEAVRLRVTTMMLSEGLGEPLWYETTALDPGTGQARQALADGAVLVCALGGDGTVRAVAAGLVGSDIPMGLLPGGTGNLFARNLGLPVDSLERALLVAITGQNHRVDVGRLQVTREEGTIPEEHLFLVMAGLGLDAQIMADTPEALKARVGGAAYFVTGARSLVGNAFKVRLRLGGEPPLTRRTRTVIIGNVGRLLGGLHLMPDALVDDGLLDVVVISPRGPMGWASVATKLATRSRRGHALVDHHAAAEIEVSVDHPEEVQVDGDTIGPARAIKAVADHLALVVRVAPRP